ncbi:MAG: ribonuclease H-like domain-containing protein [Clostridium sp.]|nr:ribonuclease H-like domain-containing protein [Clostridium sp.]
MITIKKDFSLPLFYPLERIGAPEELLFFDIETTGFSGERDRLYLIGCTWFSQGRWQLIQWFADTASAEEELLRAFFSFIKKFRTLIHFNGEGFDLPFLRKRCAYYHLPFSFDGITSLDIYRLVRPYRKLLGLEHMKQKNIEHFLGIAREDLYNGGQLIEVYADYLQSHDDFLYRLLTLHNEDDLKGMPAILPILHYPDYLNGTFTYRSQSVQEITDIFGRTEKLLILTYESPITLPRPVETEGPWFSLTLDGCRMEFRITLREGELKHFYEDYQNYYYLIYEDNAIHKSVGQYVDRTARKKATARTCYTRTCGCFLPQPSAIWSPCLKDDYQAKVLYTPYCTSLFDDPQKTEEYRKEALALCF